jgi:glycosyltransferase involved in cell wall biosynthesis
MTGGIDVSVVTPSFNMLEYLKRCCASVADQRGAICEHIVVDGASTDGSAEWLRSNPAVVATIEADNSMYEALNKGFRRARGKLIAHLNCDEQYLPGSIAFASQFMDSHPLVDVLFGDALLVRPDGSLIAYRKGFKPLLPMVLSGPLYVFTAAMFIRRRVIEDGELYDDRYKDLADVEFVARLLRAGYKMEHRRRYFSVFTMTGSNRGTITDTSHERKRVNSLTPAWISHCRRPLRVARWMMKLGTGAYRQGGPIRYSIYTSTEAGQRTEFRVDRASSRWRTA